MTLNLRMPLRTIFFGVSVFFVSVFLLLGFQSNVQAATPSSGDEQTLNEWLEKEIDWRPLGLHFYWKDGLIYEAERRFESLEEKDMSEAFKQVKLHGKIGGKLDLDGAVFIERKGLSGFDNGVQVRRARIYTKGEFFLMVPTDFKVEFGISGGFKFSLNDFYLRFNRDQYVDYFGETRNKPFRK